MIKIMVYMYNNISLSDASTALVRWPELGGISLIPRPLSVCMLMKLKRWEESDASVSKLC